MCCVDKREGCAYFTFSVFVGIFDLDLSERVHLITDSLIAKMLMEINMKIVFKELQVET